MVGTCPRTALAGTAAATKVETVVTVLTRAGERTAGTEEIIAIAAMLEIEIAGTATAVATGAEAVKTDGTTDAGAAVTIHGIGVASVPLRVTRETAVRSKTDALRAAAALRIVTRKRATTSAAGPLRRNNFDFAAN